jgi:hypothetical protein
LSANLAHASWQYWGTAPDGVTAIYRDDFGHLSSSRDGDDFGHLHSPRDAYQGALGISGLNGVLNCSNGHSWNIINGHYYLMY